MRLTFTKRDGKYDDLTVERPDGAAETIRCRHRVEMDNVRHLPANP